MYETVTHFSHYFKLNLTPAEGAFRVWEGEENQTILDRTGPKCVFFFFESSDTPFKIKR